MLAAAINVNFFAQHCLPDMRLALFAATVFLFWRTQISFTVGDRHHMPMLLASVLSASFLYLAENVGTLTGTWVYAGTATFSFASLAKWGNWYLLLFVAFVTVTVVVRDPLKRA